VSKAEFKIGYSNIGGIYMGKNTQTDFHRLHAVVIVLSFGERFTIAFEDKKTQLLYAALIQKDAYHKFMGNGKDYEIFITIDPYSKIGIELTDKEKPVQPLKIDQFSAILIDFNEWFKSEDKKETTTEQLLNKTSSIVLDGNKSDYVIDERIMKSIRLIRQHNSYNIAIDEVASAINLSSSRFAHLFKEETGITFRKFVLHSKLMRSLRAVYEQDTLTKASYEGSFSDQAHFTRTFKNAFGIKPSISVK